MAIVLGDDSYGKAENRVVRIVRDAARHEIRDINVSSRLRGDFTAAYLEGDQRKVLPTDTQKQTAYIWAKKVGLASLEGYALSLARHFAAVEPVRQARVELEEFAWERAVVDGAEHDHTWVRKGQEVRLVSATVEGEGADERVWITGGLKDLVVLKSTGSEFKDFLVDEYTVLEPTEDRVMATSLVAKWRYAEHDGIDWDADYDGIKAILVAKFATVHSLALQQTLWEMGKAVLEAYPAIAEIRLSAPNKHHFDFHLERFGIESVNEVFHAEDRPYGLIQATVTRDDAPDAGPAWEGYTGLV